MSVQVRDGDDSFEGPTTITVSIEVVLSEQNGTITPTGSDAELDSSNQDNVVQDEDGLTKTKTNYVLSSPLFRFRFIEGSCVETPVVVDASGNVAEGWEDVTPIVESEPNLEEVKDDENSPEQFNEDMLAVAEAAEDPPPSSPPPKRFRWTREFPIESVNDEFLASIHERPHFVCCLANGTESTNPEIDEEGQTSIRGNLLGFLPMDVSPLLDGDLDITRVCSSSDRGAGEPPAGINEWKMSVNVPEPLLTLPQRLRLNPMSISLERVLRLPGINIEHTRNPRMLAAMLPTRFALLKEHCRPISVLFDFKVKRSQEAAEIWKKQYDEDRLAEAEAATSRGETVSEAKVVSVADAPPFQRVVSTLPVAQEIPSELAGPTEEELKAIEKAKKKRERAAAAAKKKNKGKKRGNGGKSNQQIIDEEIEQNRDRRRRDIRFCHKTVILAGLLDKVELLRHLEKGKIQFELHDRDIEDWKACEKRRMEVSVVLLVIFLSFLFRTV